MEGTDVPVGRPSHGPVTLWPSHGPVMDMAMLAVLGCHAQAQPWGGDAAPGRRREGGRGG